MHFEKIVENLLQGLAAGKTEQQIADKHGVTFGMVQNELLKGVEVEMEHTDCPKIARRIAMDHLWERPDYYSRLNQIEKN